MTLIELNEEQQALENILLENGGELTPELEQELNDNAEAVAAKVDGYHAVIRKFSMMETAIDAEMKRLTALKKTAQNAQKNIKAHLAYAMEVSGRDTLDGTLCKLSFRSSKAMELDEAEVLAPYAQDIEALQTSLPVWTSVEVKVNKTGVKAALDAGEAIPGAAIVVNRNLQIR